MISELFANVWEDTDEVRSSTGRLFHVAGTDTAKSRRPIVGLLVRAGPAGLLRVLESPWIFSQVFKAWKVLENRRGR